jgi:hypothetical protein
MIGVALLLSTLLVIILISVLIMAFTIKKMIIDSRIVNDRMYNDIIEAASKIMKVQADLQKQITFIAGNKNKQDEG